MSYDKVAALAQFSERRGIGFAMLSDTGSKIIRAFGVLNEEHEPGSYFHGIAHPIIFVLDGKGVVRARFSERNYSDRPDVGGVLGALRKIGGA